MDLLQISKEIKTSDDCSMVPDQKVAIKLEDYLELVKEECWSNKIDSYPFGGEEVKYVVSNYIANGTRLFSLTFDEGQITISYDGRVKDEIVSTCYNIAISLGAYLLSKTDLEYPKLKVLAAQRRLMKKTKERQVKHQAKSFGGNNMWLAMRSNVDEVKSFFNLDGKQKAWLDTINDMRACESMLMFEFRGWTFVAGQKTDLLFDCQVKEEEAIEQCHVDKLLEWGKTFSDVQLFMHYNRSTYFNAFYRVLNGVMQYGEYETESYQREYGKLPKNVRDLPDNNANTVAMEWSYDPDYLRYQKELENAKAWAVNLNQEA